MDQCHVVLLVVWLLSAAWVIWRDTREFPHFEKELVENNAVYNALGYVPTSHRLFMAVVLALIAPLVVLSVGFGLLVWLRQRYELWRSRRKIRRSVARLMGLIQTAQDMLPPGEQHKLDEQRSQIERAIRILDEGKT